MEDLMQAPDSKYRRIMTSTQTNPAVPLADYVSYSCPNLAGVMHSGSSAMHISLPNHLETENFYTKKYRHNAGKNKKTYKLSTKIMLNIC